MAQLVEHWLPKPRVAGSSPVYRSKIIGCTNQCTLFFSPPPTTTNFTNHSNSHLALVNGEDRALGALRELRVISQPIQPSTPPTTVRFSTLKRNQWEWDLCEPWPTINACANKKRRAPRGVRCTPCDWNQSNPISESLIIHLFQV